MTHPKLSSAQIRVFRRNLLPWFDIYKRDLPWRRTSDPYAIWVSEIMLQQTRVAAVLDHYANWMQKFPTVEVLASATEDEVLAAWSGLGYYRRARFLHRGAKAVITEHGGRLPHSAAELRKLPGIGAYTSAAIASIAFGETVAVADGNVERVLLRQTGSRENGADTQGKSGKQPAKSTLNSAGIQKLASGLIDPARPGDFNQAMMELGAMVCLPKNPLCLQCPVQATCHTRGEHPTAVRKSALSVDISYGLQQRRRKGREEVLLELRPATVPVMPGMWELPRLEVGCGSGTPVIVLRHAIMQTSYRVSILRIDAPRNRKRVSDGVSQRWIATSDLSKLPLTGLARKILIRLEILTGR